MTRKKWAIIGGSAAAVLMIAGISVGVVSKMNRVAAYEEYMARQQTQEAQAAARADGAPDVPAIDAASSAAPVVEKIAGDTVEAPTPPAAETHSAPEIVVSIDEQGNQTITEKWEKPASPPEEELHNPESAPETPDGPKNVDQQIKDEGVRFDENGNQIPNEKGEVFVPGFGWMKSDPGGRTEVADFELSGNKIGY